MRGMLALFVAVAAAWLLFKDTRSDAPPVARAQARPPVLTLDRPIEGTLYFSAARTRADGGPADEESVFRLRKGDSRPVRVLPRNPRTWFVSAWGSHVLVSTEGDGFLAAAGAVRLHPDGRTGRTVADDAHGPAAGPGGRMAYQGYVQRRSVSAVFVRWTRRDRFRVIARRGIWAMAFLPDGRLVVVQRRNARAWIMVFSKRGLEHEFRVPGNPQYDVLVTSAGLIGYEGGTRRLRLYTPSGRRRGSLDMTDWVPAGTRGRRFLLVERDGNRIASMTTGGDLELLGRFDPAYQLHTLEWER